MVDGLFQPTHLILILLIIFIVFGAGKLPEVGSALGRGIGEFRRAANESPETEEAEPFVGQSRAEHGPGQHERRQDIS